ncbi:MAG: M20/M25/M40 family metallo-hydrolase [Caldilineae bacterium]|nr:M20/M25/M40 family metallo-hydrolase [Chloroflexota bacterium]MCB9177508.1 M20/M25/M40 family metallo-hydrolase [Caldilineae bacterium]
MNELIHTLCEAWGPSGHEGRVRQIIEGLVDDLVDEMRVDALGNLVCRVAPAPGVDPETAPRLMLAAHMDEIGVIVTHVDEAGYLRFAPVGGVIVGSLPGKRVTFEDGSVGVINVERREDASRQPGLDHLYIDVGAADKSAVTQGVGDAASFRQAVDWAGGRPIAANHDDRIGCVVLVETLRRLKRGPNAVYAVFTVQEEIGLRGATTSGYGVAPDAAIAIDVTGSGDTPKGMKMDVHLGKGPAIKVKDGGMIAHRGLRALMEQRAEEAGIAFQLEVLTGGTTDAMAIQTSRAGVPAGCVSIPSRYVHSPSQLVDMQDVEGAVQLLCAVAEGSLADL